MLISDIEKLKEKLRKFIDESSVELQALDQYAAFEEIEGELQYEIDKINDELGDRNYNAWCNEHRYP